ncbi:hypothetical protein C9975_06320 [Thalassospira xiamenensis]|nr:hypothetical protein C9975_06320 [Thalassospira xiamenensis]
MDNFEESAPTLTYDSGMQTVAYKAMRIMPFCSSEFLQILLRTYKSQDTISRGLEWVSAEFLAVMTWLKELENEEPHVVAHETNLQVAVMEYQQGYRTLGVPKPLPSYDIVSYDMSGDIISRLAELLFSRFNLEEGTSLVLALGEGCENSNLEATESWVKATLVSHDMSVTHDAIDELILLFERALNT